MKILNLIVALIIVVAAALLSQQIMVNSLANQRDKSDYAELNHVKYGLFSVDEWKRQMTIILVEEIDKLSLSRTNERDLRRHVEVLLNRLINDVDKKIRAGNEGSAGGWAKQAFINTFISLEEIKKGIPAYADAVMKEMTKEETRDQIKAMLNKQLADYAAQTFWQGDAAQVNRILLETESGDIAGARVKLLQRMTEKNNMVYKETGLLIGLAVILFAAAGLYRQPLNSVHYILLVLILILLLLAGVTTPMIDMEAKITKMSFMLMGYPISFENQILYFQSKSILDVFWIMITHKDIQMKFVGVLIVTFSVIFPLLKIVSSIGYYYHQKSRENPLISFFVLKSGKWSMADVMVVAIFMAYIGFNGIISSQFGQLNTESQQLVILATNGTSLQPGFYLFLTYAILALFLSGFLSKSSAREDWQLTP